MAVNEPKTLGMLNDPRKITSLVAQTHDETNYWEVGKNNVTKISVEAVPGNGAMVPWFVVLDSNGDLCRVNGAFVYFINYHKETES